MFALCLPQMQQTYSDYLPQLPFSANIRHMFATNAAFCWDYLPELPSSANIRHMYAAELYNIWSVAKRLPKDLAFSQLIVTDLLKDSAFFRLIAKHLPEDLGPERDVAMRSRDAVLRQHWPTSQRQRFNCQFQCMQCHPAQSWCVYYLFIMAQVVQ